MAKQRLVLFSLVVVSIGIGCGSNTPNDLHTSSFTKVDSLTENYLEMQELLLHSWHMIVHDEAGKIKAMHGAVHELMYSGREDNTELVSLEHRLDELSANHLTQETLKSPEMLEEYDFAVNALTQEVVSLAESHSTYTYNKVLQKLVEQIKLTDQRSESNRSNYDSIAIRFNEFLGNNRELVKEIDHKGSLDERPLFGLVNN